MKNKFSPQEEQIIINAIHRQYHIATEKLMQAESWEEEQKALEEIEYCKEILKKCYENN